MEWCALEVTSNFEKYIVLRIEIIDKQGVFVLKTLFILLLYHVFFPTIFQLFEN